MKSDLQPRSKVMNPTIIQQFIDLDWGPRLWYAGRLRVFGISYEEAEKWVRSINGPDEKDTVSDNELRAFLKDKASITELPSERGQLTSAGLWLLEEQGWGFNPESAIWRYIDPTTNIPHTLRHAIIIQLRVVADQGVAVDDPPSMEDPNDRIGSAKSLTDAMHEVDEQIAGRRRNDY